ncbi:MAG: DUF2760 domain-containing protein [bacterium]|nr:DUF2760 domain-containing protein [bacterium]
MSPIVVALLLGVVVGGGNWWALGQLGVDPQTAMPFVAAICGAPLLATLLTALTAPKAAAGAAPEPAAKAALAPAKPSPKPVEPPEHTALRLLAALQEEGRLVDFLTEDIGPYSDEQVGAATRGIHASCAKALQSYVRLEPVLAGKEEDTVTVPAGFDPATIRLTGNVQGQPPFKGVLRHPGWKAASATIPPRAGLDPRIIAPAEVEIA